MSILTSYTSARARFKKLCDEVASTREPVIIHRRNGDDVALVSADELESLTETAHLLRSPTNAARLVSALIKAQKGKGRKITLDSLRKDLKLA